MIRSFDPPNSNKSLQGTCQGRAHYARFEFGGEHQVQTDPWRDVSLWMVPFSRAQAGKRYSDVPQQPKPGGNYLLNCFDCPSQTCDSDLKQSHDGNPEYFKLIINAQSTSSSVFPDIICSCTTGRGEGWGWRRFYGLKMRKFVGILWFNGHRYLQQAGSSWKEDHTLWYHTIVIPMGLP